MKKLLSAVLAAAMCCVMAVPAFAADTVIVPDEDGNPSPDRGDTTVSFNIAPTYTITIPEKVELERKVDAADGTVTYERDAEITAENVRLAEGETIQVTLTGDFALDVAGATEYTLPYTVTAGENPDAVSSGGVVATFGTSTATQTGALHFAAGNPTCAGNYSDTVTFTLSVS